MRDIEGSLRGSVLAYAKKKYKTEPEYLWLSAPDFTVLRHGDNRKWYAIIMDIERKKLGLEGEGMVDILDIKCEPVLIGTLLGVSGYLPAYHMHKGNWITVLLDGSVPEDEIFQLIDLSFDITAPKRVKKK